MSDDETKPCSKCGTNMEWYPRGCYHSLWVCPNCEYRELEEYDPDCEEDAGYV